MSNILKCMFLNSNYVSNSKRSTRSYSGQNNLQGTRFLTHDKPPKTFMVTRVSSTNDQNDSKMSE